MEGTGTDDFVSAGEPVPADFPSQAADIDEVIIQGDASSDPTTLNTTTLDKEESVDTIPPWIESEVISRLEKLQAGLNEANRISQDRERIVDRLHEENQRLRTGELRQAMAPI